MTSEYDNNRITITNGYNNPPKDTSGGNNGNGPGGNAGTGTTTPAIVLYKGQMGYWEDRTTGGGNNEHTTRVFIAVGPSEAEKAATAAKTLQEKQQAEATAAAAAQKAAADARAREEEEARQRAAGLSQAEIDAQKRVNAAQAAINTAQGSVNTLNGAVSTANQVVTQKQAEMAGLNSQLATDQEQERQTRRFANDPIQSRIFLNARAAMVRTQNAISSKQNEINTAVANRDSLNTQLSQANTALQNAQNEKTAADTALNVAHGERIAAENKQKEAAAAAAEQKRLADIAAAAAEQDRIAAEEASTLQDAVKFTADFFKELTEKYSQNASELAQNFATQAKGKTLRDVDQALAAFDKYKGSLGNKFSSQDRAAIVAALNSKTFDDMANSLIKYSRAFGFVGSFIDLTGTVLELKKAIETDNWRPFFVKIESLIAGKAASGVTAFAFTVMTGLPMGIIGFALIMAVVGAYVDDSLIDSINIKLGI